MTTGRITTRGRWLALAAASLSWMCDGLEMGLFPLVARNALAELCPPPVSEQVIAEWYGIITACFLIGAAAGGVLFGWLGDRIGRVRALIASVIVYSACSGLSALAMHPSHLAALRFLGALGMGGEWALGVALVMELWPNNARHWLAGCIGFAGNFGFACCGAIGFLVLQHPQEIHAILESLELPSNLLLRLSHGNYWRLLMLLGTGPALLALLIRLFVPESEKWQRAAIATQASTARDLCAIGSGTFLALLLIVLWQQPCLWTVRLLATLLMLAVIMYLFMLPARRAAMRQPINAFCERTLRWRLILASIVSAVPLLGTWSAVMWMYPWAGQLPGGGKPLAVPFLQITTSLSAAFACIIVVVFCTFLKRRLTYIFLCILSAVSVTYFYQFNIAYNNHFLFSAIVMSAMTASFYGFLALYLPELFPTAVRASGQGFGFNFARIIAAIGTLQVPVLLEVLDGDYTRACLIPIGIYFLGIIAICFAPETAKRPLPD